MSTSRSEARVDGADECARGRHLKKRATRHFVAHKTPKEARVGAQYTQLLSLSERLTQPGHEPPDRVRDSHDSGS
jgi:hypothetical protein